MIDVHEINQRAKELQKEIWGNMDLFEKNYAEMIKILSLALENDPNDIATLTNMGTALCDVGEYEKAKLYLNKAISLGSKDRNTYFSMGVACINTVSEYSQFFAKAERLKYGESTWEAYFDPQAH